MFKPILLFSLLFAYSLPTLGSIYKYTELQVKTLDEMQAFISRQMQTAESVLQDKKLSEDEAIQGAVDKYRDTLKFIFSRPDRDNMVGKLIPSLRTKLRNLNSYDDSLAFLTTQAINSINNRKIDTVYRATSVYILQNIMSEMQPLLEDGGEAMRIYKKIRKAKIRIPKVVVKHINKYGIFKRTDSPSEIAAKVLKKYEKPKKKK